MILRQQCEVGGRLMSDQTKKLSPRDEELATMMETEFPALWKTALKVAQGNRNVALSMIVRLVRRHIEVAASERERRLTGGETYKDVDDDSNPDNH
jgi:hypothetical protein